MNTGIKIIVVSMILVILPGGWLQAQSTIKGTVLNNTGQALPNVSVLLLRSRDSILVKGIVSDTMGGYMFRDILKGDYLLSFTCTGYKAVYSSPYSITGGQNDVLAGKMQLSKESTELNKVTVTARKPLFEQKIDRLVINVRNSITAVGSTALDVLERSPGVVVDRQNNALTMGGKEGVLVMINGKESHLPVAAIVQMLAGMNSATIEKIELITTPPSNFSAEGNAGIINIVLVDNNGFGTNGSFALTGGVGKTKVSAASFNFNHRKGKLNLYGDYSFRMDWQEQAVSAYRKIDFGGKITEASMANERDSRIRNFTGRMGADLQVTKRTTIGAMISGYINRWIMDATSQTSIAIDQQVDTLIEVRNHEHNDWNSIGVNLNAQHIFRKGSRISLNLDYLYYHDINPNYYLNTYFDKEKNFVYEEEVRSDKLTPITFWIGSADYTKKLGKKTDLQAGLKFTRSGFTNDILIARLFQDTWIADPSYSENYELKENISAAYISLITNLDVRTNIKLGLRYEYTNSNLGTDDIKNIVDRHYGKLFPSFFISRKIDDDNTINFSYSRRITRPGFGDLAPFTVFFDPNSLTTGNPALQASTADAVNAAYSYKSYLVSISYSEEADAIARFQTSIDPATNRQISSPENIRRLKIAALTLSVPLNLTRWWSMQNNLVGRWQQASSVYKGTGITLEQKNFRITCTQSFKLPKDFAIDFSGFYQSGELRGRAILRPLRALDFGIQKKMEKGKGKLSFAITDIFSSITYRGYTDLPAENLVTRRNMQFTQRMFKLTYSRSFGNTRLEGKRSKTDSSEEERKRVE